MSLSFVMKKTNLNFYYYYSSLLLLLLATISPTAFSAQPHECNQSNSQPVFSPEQRHGDDGVAQIITKEGRKSMALLRNYVAKQA